MPNGDTVTPLSGIAVVRADDLLDLTFDFHNLGLRRGGPPVLVRVDPAASALVVVGFPPQSVGEQLSQGIEIGLPLESALSERSRLAFEVPAGVTEIPFTLDGLLDWSRLTPSVAEMTGPPSSVTTAIEAPWHLILTTGPRARWLSPRRAVTRDGVTELWTTRLDPGLLPTDRVMRPIWTADVFTPTSLRTALADAERSRIVERGGVTSSNHPSPIAVRRLELSSRGAWLDVDGGWNDPDPELPDALDIELLAHHMNNLFEFPGEALTEEELKAETILLVDRAITDLVAGLSAPELTARRRVVLERMREEVQGQAGQLAFEVLADMEPRPRFEWSHRMLQGRDDKVRTLTPGILLPWGFAVDLVQSTARSWVDFFSYDAASLLTHASIRVREPVRSFSASQYQFQGRETPFGSARLTGDTTVPVGRPADTASPFWVRTSDGAADFGWTVVLTDRAGRPVAVTMPMLFVPTDVARTPGGIDAAWSTYASDPRGSIDLRGQTVTLTGDDPQRATALEVHSVKIGGSAMSLGERAPMLTSAEVSVSAVNALLGTAGVSARVPFTYHHSFLAGGFGSGNPMQLFADLRAADPDARDLEITSLPERTGGLVRPDLAVQGLSRLLGPVPDIENVVRGTLDPDRFIPDVKILGGIPLKALIAKVASGLTPGDLGDLAGLGREQLWAKLQEHAVSLPMPALTSRRIGPVEAPTAVETRFVWKPRLKLDGILPKGLVLDDTARLMVMSTVHAPLDGSAPTFESTGVLADFAIHFLDVVKVELASLTFVARGGRKPELDAKGVRLAFEGDLAFVEEIRSFIPPDGFSDPPSVSVSPTGITAGYSLGLPTIGVGVFSLENIALSAALELPFVDGPTRLRFQLSERHDPFLVTVSLFGGGGFFGITIDTDDNIGVEAAVEFGGNFCLDLVVASGGVHVMAGIYFKMAGPVVQLSGYLRAGGSVTVLGVITVSVEFYLALTYTHSDGPPKQHLVSGEAVLTVGVDILFLHQDVTLRVRREFASPDGDPTFEQLVSQDAWTTYCDAFAD